jgi:hypothetical protein
MSRTWDEEETPENAIILLSLGVSFVLLSVQSLLLGVSAVFVDEIGDRLSQLFADGVFDYASFHPEDILIGAPAVYLSNSVILAAVGSLDPIGWAEGKQLFRKGVRQHSAWYLTFWPAQLRRPTQSAPNFVRVIVKGTPPTEYVGALGVFDLRSDKHGERNIQLWDPHRLKVDGSWIPVTLDDRSRASVLLKCSEIVSIEVTYTGVPTGHRSSSGTVAERSAPNAQPSDRA